MAFDLFEVSPPHVVYACLGGFTVLFGMFSLLLREKLYIGEACWAFLFGVIVGPYGANIFNPRGWGGGDSDVSNLITLEVTRVVLAIGVFAIGVELPKRYMARHWKSLFFLLCPIMTWGWFVSAGLIYALIPGLNFLSSLAVAACLTPTDPILAAAVVGGKYADKHVPAHLRHLLAAESGCNDGAAFPFLYIALYLVLDKPDTDKAIKDWFLLLWLYQVILGVVLGSLIGFGFRHLMKFCERKDLIDRQSYVAQYVSLALLTIGICTLLGSDDLLAAFCCGTAFAWDGFFNKQTEEAVFSSVIDLLFNVAAFVFVGAWMPFKEFQSAALTITVWRLIVIAILVLLLRRLPVMIALYKFIPDVKTFREAIFSGHFGPIGVGAVFISTLAAQKLEHPEDPPANQEQFLAASIQPIVAFMVLCSITIHGLSIPFFSLGRRVHSISHTWSRHEPSEWTTQARHIQRGDEIVINRDPDLERGDLTPDEKLAIASQRASEEESSATPSKEADTAPAPSAPSPSAPKEKVAELAGAERTDEHGDPTEAAKEENLPDGTETMQEWQEGPHKIVERRAGPGEEVDVEVIRNVYGHEPMSSSFQGTRDAVHKNVPRMMKALGAGAQHAPKEKDKFEKEVKKVEHELRDGIVSVEHKVEDMLSPQSSRTGNDDGGENEDEEGWASDNGDGAGSSSAEPRQRSKSPKKSGPKAGRIAPAPPRARRRDSIRRGILGHAHRIRHASTSTAIPSSAIEDSDAEDDERGRTTDQWSTTHSRSGSASSRTPAHLRHIDTRLREASPARSVRFADLQSPRSRPDTPRSASFARDSTASNRDSNGSASAPDPPASAHTHDNTTVQEGGHVSFDVPRSPKR